METVNLKSAVTFRVELNGRLAAFTTKTFRGKRLGDGLIPEPKQLVPYDVQSIVIDSADPWFTLDKWERVSILWSNVLSVQHEISTSA